MIKIVINRLVNFVIYICDLILVFLFNILGKELPVSLRNTVNQFVRFGFVGVSNTVIYYVCYVFLLFLGVNYIISNIISFSVGVLNSYLLNNKYVFKSQNELSKSLRYRVFAKTYISYFFSGVILSNLILFYCVNNLHLSEVVSPLICLLITVPTNFVLNKYWSYKT